MKAVRVHQYGSPEELKYEEVPIPEPQPDEVLIRVHATSVNPVDWKMRSGAAKALFPLSFPAILGRDVAGEIAKVGASVSTFKPGQKVMGVVNGSYAEYLTAKAATLTLVPEGLDLITAAALPLVTLTGAQLIERATKPKSGDLLLITGALGSVGRTAVYVAGQHGARVIAGVRAKQKTSAESLKAARIAAIDNDAEIESLPQLDAIADTIDGEVLQKLIAKCKPGATLGSVLGKPKAAEGKDIRVEAFTAQPDPQRLHRLAEDVCDGKFTIPVAKTLKLNEAAEAHRLGEKGGIDGKIVLVP
jgi:NADPH:quinone reductase-like Zn-dependent oxidoreductase